MSKELKAFSKEKQALDELYDVAGNVQNLKEDYIILKSALQRLESINNVNPSESLKSLERIRAFLLHKTREVSFQDLRDIEQALLKAQEQEKELADVEEVKSGKTIIYIGKDLIMMNKAKYNEYLEIKREPVSKRILRAKCEEQEKVLEIIKGRHIDILNLEECIEREKMGNVASALEYYNENYAFNRSCELAQEEFDLLKRYLNDNSR